MKAKVIQNDDRIFQLQISNTHYSLVNAVRRGVLSVCPAKSLVVDEIAANDSGINNDLIRHHMGLIWVPQELENLVVKLNKTNTSEEAFLEVGPRDFECFQNSGDDLKKIANPWKESLICITKLRPNETITLEATAVEGTTKDNGGHFTAAHCFYHSNTPEDHLLTVESRRRETPVRTWNRTLTKLQERVHRVKLNLQAKHGESKHEDSQLEIMIEGENHTLGGALTYLLQQHPKVKGCGYDMPHPLYEKIKLQLKTTGEAFPILVESLEQLHQLFGDMKKSI